MAGKLLVIDTSVALIVFFGSNSDQPERVDRVHKWMRHFTREGYHFVVPAVVVSELGKSAPTEIIKKLESVEVAPFTYPMALKAAALVDDVKGAIKAGADRQRIKFDATVAATAIEFGAMLVHANPADFKILLKKHDQVRQCVADLDEPPPTDQAVMQGPGFERQKPKPKLVR